MESDGERDTGHGGDTIPRGEGATSTGQAPHVELRGIGKRFGPARVLEGVDVRLRRGRVHALVGENGAGKSTLGKIIAGVHRPDGGELVVDGRSVTYRAPHGALGDGLTIVAQELSLLPARSVVENVFLGSESRHAGLIDDRDMQRRYAELDARTGFGLPATARVGSLRIADQQKVEILRAVARDGKLIVMDEPTAPLDNEEARRLGEIVRRLSDDGTTIVYISHDLDEVLRLADDVTVLRDGVVVRSGPAAAETSDTLITGMIGRSLDRAFPRKRVVDRDQTPALEVRALCTEFLRDVNLTVMPGEIVGLAGLVGSGRSEIAHAIFGADPTATGTVLVNGDEVPSRSTRAAMRAGAGELAGEHADEEHILRLAFGASGPMAEAA